MEDEIISIVNDEDNVIGFTDKDSIRHDCLLHREVAIFIFNADNEMLLQKRSDNGSYDFSVAGYVRHKESFLECAVRELKEELGIKMNKNRLNIIQKKKVHLDFGHCVRKKIVLYMKILPVKLDDIKINRNEVDSVVFFSVGNIEEMIYRNPERFAKGFIKGFGYCKKDLIGDA